MTNGKSPLSQSAVILKSTWILQTSSPFDAKDMCLIEQPGICDFLLMKLILYCAPSKNITDEHYMKIRGQTYENNVKMNIIVNPFAATTIPPKTITKSYRDTEMKRYIEMSYAEMHMPKNESKYSRMDQVKFVQDSL